MIRLRNVVVGIAALTLGFTMSHTVYAANSDLQLTLDENGSFYYSTHNQVSNGKISLGEMFQGMAPGETRTATTTITNDCTYADFYISTQTLDTFEDYNESGATNGYYDIQLSVSKDGEVTYVYDSTLGGYTGDQTSSAYGLLAMNENLDSYLFLTTLDEKESAVVTFSITLDGETVRNSYFEKDAVVDFDYQAVYKANSVVTVTGKGQVNTVERTKTEYVTATTTISDEDTARASIPSGVAAAKTGDTFEIYIYSVLLVLALIVFALTFKKNKQDKNMILFALLLAGSLSISAKADSEEYLITYRVGNMGTFDVDSYTLPENEYTIVDKNAYYVTVKVKFGAHYPVCPDVILADDLYEVNNQWLVGFDGSTGTVSKNEEIVVDYTRLTDPIEYMVTYQTKDGTILGKKSGKGNVAETIEFAKNFTGYRVSSTVTSMTLKNDVSQNLLVIEYVTDDALTTGVDYVYVPGQISTVYLDVTETVSVPGTVGIVGGASAPGVLPLTPQTTIGADLLGTSVSVTQQNTQNAHLGDEEAAVFYPENMIMDDQIDPDPTVTINDQEVANEESILINDVDDGDKKENLAFIEDEMTPTTGTIAGDTNVSMIVISGVVVMLVICVTAIVFSRQQKKKGMK